MAGTTLANSLDSECLDLSADTITQHKDSTVQKKSFFTKFLDYFNDANKNKKQKKFDFSIIGGPHYSTDTKLGLGLVIVRTGMIRFSLPPMFPYSAMSLQWDSTCWEYVARIYFHRISIAWIIRCISTLSLLNSGGWVMIWVT